FISNRGVATSRGIAATSAAVLAFLLLVTVVPAVTFLPSAAVVATGGEHGPPTSTVGPLPEYTTSQVVTISYTSFRQGQGTGGDDDHAPQNVIATPTPRSRTNPEVLHWTAQDA